MDAYGVMNYLLLTGKDKNGCNTEGLKIRLDFSILFPSWASSIYLSNSATI